MSNQKSPQQSSQSLILANASRETHLIKAPKLRHGGDEEKAAQLEVYITRAESGLISILQAGFYIECIAADLKQGQMKTWVEAHCPTRKWRTVQRWKQVASNLGEVVGVKYKQRIELKLYEVLALPLDKVPEKIRPIREKLDNEIAGKTYRQLFLEFKQVDEDEENPAPKRGRNKGCKGTTKEQRDAAKAAEETARIKEIELSAKGFGKWMDEVSDEQGIAKISDKAFEAYFDKLAFHYRFCSVLSQARKGGDQK